MLFNLNLTYVLALLLQFVNDLHALISPVPAGTPVPIVLLGKVFKPLNCMHLEGYVSS